MKLFSNAIPVLLAVVIVTLGLATAAQGEWIYANRRYASTNSNAVFDAAITVYNTATGANETPDGFGEDYTSGDVVEGLAYYDGNLYVSSGADDGEAHYIRVYNAETGYYDTAFAASSSGDKVRGLDFDSDGYLYAAIRGSNKIVKIDMANSYTATDLFSTSAIPSDVVVYGDNLYAGQTGGGVYCYALDGSGSASVLVGTEGTRCDGIAFTDDGTMYTTANNSTNLLEWTWDDNEGKFVATAIAIGAQAPDVDYLNGVLYMSTNTASKAILTYDIATSTLSTWQNTGLETGAYLAIGPAVPEPGTLALLASGLLGLLAYAWRKRK